MSKNKNETVYIGFPYYATYVFSSKDKDSLLKSNLDFKIDKKKYVSISAVAMGIFIVACPFIVSATPYAPIIPKSVIAGPMVDLDNSEFDWLIHRRYPWKLRMLIVGLGYVTAWKTGGILLLSPSRSATIGYWIGLLVSKFIR